MGTEAPVTCGTTCRDEIGWMVETTGRVDLSVKAIA